MNKLILALISLLLLAPSYAYAQSGTVRSRTLDADGNAITSGTSAPAGTERGIHTRQVGPADVNCLSGCATATDATGTTVTFNDGADTATVALAGLRGAMMDVEAGTCDATLVAEVSTNGMDTWVSAYLGDSSTGLVSTSLELTSPNSASSFTILYPGSITHARVKSSAFTGGACDVTLRATTVSPVSISHGIDLSGSGVQPLPMLSTTPDGTEMAPLFRCIGCTSTGGTNAADNTVWVYGTTAVTPSGFVYDTTPSAPTDGRVGVARMNVNRDAHSMLVGPDGTEVVENTNGVLVSLTTVASTQGYNRRVASAVSAGLSLSIDSNGAGTVMWEIDGACTCTIVFEGTLDPGGSPTYFAVPAVRQDTRQIITSLTNPSGAVRGYFKQVGFRKVQVRVSSHAAGTPNLRLELSNGNSGIDPTDITCTESIVINTSSSGDQQLVALTSGENIYVCGWSIISGGTTNVKLIDGTGANCGTSPSNLTGPYPLTAQVGLADRASKGTTITKTTATGRALCINNSAAVSIAGVLNYAKF